MKKWMIPILALSALLVACTAAPAQLDARAGKGHVFKTTAGQQFAIRLNDNPSTGYEWQREFDSAMLVLQAAEFEPADPSGSRVGAGGTATLRFKALKAGQTVVRLTYRRPWEQEVADERVITVSID